MTDEIDKNGYDWREHAPETTLSPDIIFGFNFDLNDPGADRSEIQRRLLGGAETMAAGGFSNKYANYVNLESMHKHLEGFSAALGRAEELKAEMNLKRWIFWWTPGVLAEKANSFLDICSSRSLNACETFLKRIAENKTDRLHISGNRADYDDFDYIEVCMIELYQGQLYYADYWDRGYVSDDRFDAEKVDQPWDYHSYRDPNYEAFQSKAQKSLEQFTVVKNALVKALGDEVLTRKYFNF